MANPNAPFGFRSVTRLDGGLVGRLKSEYTIADSYATAIGYLDLVAVTGTAVATADPRYQGPGISRYVQGTNSPTGVFNGCAWQDTLGNFIWSKNYLATTVTLNAQGIQAFVEDDPQIIFETQVSLGFAIANTRSFFRIVATAPNALGISQETIDSANITTTFTASVSVFKVLKLSPAPGNAYGNFARVYGFLAAHELRDPQLQL